MADTDRDIFNAAMADELPAAETQTEQPLANDTTRDERGRFAPKEIAPEPVVAKTPTPLVETPKPVEESIPSWRLREEAERRRDLERQFADMQQREAALRRQLAEARPPAKTPDLLEDPDAYARYVEQTVERRMLTRFVDASMEDAHEQHGEEFAKAFNSLLAITNSGDTSTRDRIVQSPNPGRALMRWHQERQAITEIGGDLKKYQARIREEAMKDPEFRKAAMEAWRSEASGGNGQRPATVTQLPSLNKATGGGHSSASDKEPVTDKELFASVVRRRA